MGDPPPLRLAFYWVEFDAVSAIFQPCNGGPRSLGSWTTWHIHVEIQRHFKPVNFIRFMVINFPYNVAERETMNATFFIEFENLRRLWFFLFFLLCFFCFVFIFIFVVWKHYNQHYKLIAPVLIYSILLTQSI